MKLFFIMQICMMCSGLFYMLGGREMSIKSGWLRDLFCPIISLMFAMWIFPHQELWKYSTILIVQFISCRTYFTFLNIILHEINNCSVCLARPEYYCEENLCYSAQKSREKKWFNWLLIGIVSSAKWLVFIPNLWWMLIIKAFLVMIVSLVFDTAEHEEFMRGAFIL